MNPNVENQSEESNTGAENLNDEQSEENYFNNLFKDTCKIFQKKFPIERILINGALRDIKDSFKNFTFTSVDFDSIKYSFAYFEHYSLLLAASSRHRFLNAIENCEGLKTYVNKPELNVISLGGGPGTDMVGFCSALQEYREDREDQNQLLNFCVVDRFKRWECFYDIIKDLLREKSYGNASKIFQKSQIRTSFMEVDLMERNPSQEYNTAVNNADIVLLARVLDALPYHNQNPEDMLLNIAERMKKDALLLLFDCGDYNCELLSRIYASSLDKFFVENVSPDQAGQSNAQIRVYVKNM